MLDNKNLETYLDTLENELSSLLSPFSIYTSFLKSPLKAKSFPLGYAGYLSEMNEEDEIEYIPPFYSDYKLYHFNLTDAIMTFQLCGYEVERIKISKQSLYAKLRYADERIYLFTMPDTFFIRLKSYDDENKSNESDEDVEIIEVEGFSTAAFYKLGRSKKIRILELPEITPIFVNYMKRYLYLLYSRLYSEEYEVYIL